MAGLLQRILEQLQLATQPLSDFTHRVGDVRAPGPFRPAPDRSKFAHCGTPNSLVHIVIRQFVY